MPAGSASAWQIGLAHDLHHALKMTAEDEGAHLRALYASIGWANQLRRKLLMPREDAAIVRAEGRPPARALRAPGRWEVVLLRQASSCLARRGARLLKLLCRHLNQPLVDTSGHRRLDEVLQILSRLTHLAHPMLEGADAAFKQVLAAYVVWDAYPSIIFHPSLTAKQRIELESRLCHWWTLNWTAHDGGMEARRLAPIPIGAAEAVSRDLVDVLSYCVRAAMSSRWSAERSALVGMWRPPPELAAGVASIRCLMTGLGRLQFAELCFVEALLHQDLTEANRL